ncbi:MAG: hypothetical protein ACE5H0_14450 [Bacteroidota bacterium]
MIELATVAQAVAVFSACWAIISGIGAWKREFVGKRQIELAEQVLAKFFEIRDAVAFIRNPFSHSDEGKTRKRAEHETPGESELLDRGYIVVERYSQRETVFAEFNALKYRFVASFGAQMEEIFTESDRVVNSIFISARMLATHYWQRQGRVKMESDEFQKHLEEMHRHEGIFWDTGSENDEIRTKLAQIQSKLETAVKPCFQEPVGLYSFITRKWR